MHDFQKEQSSYQLVEAELGSKLSSHNLHIYKQLGADMITKLSNFKKKLAPNHWASRADLF